MLLSISSQRLHTANISFISFLITTSGHEIVFFFFFHINWPHKLSKPQCTHQKSNLLVFWHPSHHVKTLMTTLLVEAAMPYSHFPFSFLWDRISILPTFSLSWKCCRHVDDMSTAGSNVGKFQKQLVCHWHGIFLSPSHVSEACRGH